MHCFPRESKKGKDLWNLMEGTLIQNDYEIVSWLTCRFECPFFESKGQNTFSETEPDLLPFV